MSDEEAEAFLEQDLSNLDYSRFQRVTFELMPKEFPVEERIPSKRLQQSIREMREGKGKRMTLEEFKQDLHGSAKLSARRKNKKKSKTDS